MMASGLKVTKAAMGTPPERRDPCWGERRVQRGA